MVNRLLTDRGMRSAQAPSFYSGVTLTYSEKSEQIGTLKAENKSYL